jgi:hypothetical protein
MGKTSLLQLSATMIPDDCIEKIYTSKQRPAMSLNITFAINRILRRQIQICALIPCGIAECQPVAGGFAPFQSPISGYNSSASRPRHGWNIQTKPYI